MTPEGKLMRLIELAVCEHGARVIRVNAGQGWIGPSTRRPDGTVTIKNARPFHGVPQGVSDLVGWRADGKFLAIEVKTPTGRATPEQLAFIAAVQAAGGVAGVVRSVEEAVGLVSS